MAHNSRDNARARPAGPSLASSGAMSRPEPPPIPVRGRGDPTPRRSSTACSTSTTRSSRRRPRGGAAGAPVDRAADLLHLVDVSRHADSHAAAASIVRRPAPRRPAGRAQGRRRPPAADRALARGASHPRDDASGREACDGEEDIDMMTLITGLVGITLLVAFLGIMTWWIKALPFTLIVVAVVLLLLYDSANAALRRGRRRPLKRAEPAPASANRHGGSVTQPAPGPASRSGAAGHRGRPRAGPPGPRRASPPAGH